ncbi:MAG: recombinase family protein [bacterium]
MAEAMTDTRTVRCAIYTRKSTDEGLEQEFNSLDAQREAGEAYVASQRSQGWVCLPTRYDDGGYTRGNLDRPALQRLLKDVEDGEVDTVVVYKVDRLSRSLLDFANMMGILEGRGVSLVSVTQQFNTTSSMGRLTLNILLSFAQFEREIISERTRDKVAAARRKGKWTGGPQFLGYDLARDNGGSRLVINKTEAKQVRATYELYLEEGSMQAALKVIRERGWKTKRSRTQKGHFRGGSEFSKSTLQKLLTNPLYLGKMTYKGEVVEGRHDAIIDEDLFARVQGLLGRNRNSGGKHVRNKYNALLKGLVRCKHCGCAMSHHFTTRGNKRYRYYVCVRAQKRGWSECPAPSLPAKELEDFVAEQIKGLGKDAALLEESVRATQVRLQAEIDELERQRSEVEERIRGLGHKVGEIAPRAGFDDGATRKLDLLQQEMKLEQKEVARLNKEMAVIRRRMLDPDELGGAVEAFDPLWQSLSPSRKTKLIHLLVDQVEYDGEAETISVTFHPTGIQTLIGECEEAAG